MDETRADLERPRPELTEDLDPEAARAILDRELSGPSALSGARATWSGLPPAR